MIKLDLVDGHKISSFLNHLKFMQFIIRLKYVHA